MSGIATTVDSFHTGSSVLSIVRVLNFSLPSLPCLTVTNGSLLPEKRVETQLGNLLDFLFFWLSLYKQLWDQISLPSPLNGQLWTTSHPSPLNKQLWDQISLLSPLSGSSGTTSHPFPLNRLFWDHTSPPLPCALLTTSSHYVLSSVYYNADRFHQKGASSIFLVHILFLLFIS